MTKVWNNLDATGQSVYVRKLDDVPAAPYYLSLLDGSGNDRVFITNHYKFDTSSGNIKDARNIGLLHSSSGVYDALSQLVPLGTITSFKYQEPGGIPTLGYGVELDGTDTYFEVAHEDQVGLDVQPNFTNKGFELGSGNTFTNWNIGTQNGGAVAEELVTVHTGVRAAELSTGLTTADLASIDQRLVGPVRQNEWYTVSFYARGASAGDTLRVAVRNSSLGRNYDSSGNWIDVSTATILSGTNAYTFSLTTTYTRYTVSFKTDDLYASQDDNFRIFFGVSETATAITVFLDDVQISQGLVLMGWVRLDEGPPTGVIQPILSKRGENGAGYELSIDPASGSMDMTLTIYDDQGNSVSASSPTNSLVINEWQAFFAKIDWEAGTEGTLTVALGPGNIGSAVNISTYKSTSTDEQFGSIYSPAPFRVGASPDLSIFFPGWIGEVIVAKSASISNSRLRQYLSGVY